MAKRVLVVEDDVLNSMFICATLESRGFAVKAVTDGAQVLSAVRAFDPDLVTMDINLPNVSGVKLIEKLKAEPKLKQIPVIATPVFVGRGEETRIRGGGAAIYLAKPISIKPFMASVERLLEEGS